MILLRRVAPCLKFLVADARCENIIGPKELQASHFAIKTAVLIVTNWVGRFFSRKHHHQQQQQKRLPLTATGSTDNPSTPLHVIELSWCDMGVASCAVAFSSSNRHCLLSLQTGSEHLTTAISRLEQVTERLLRFEVRM